jgi:UV DNA damage endonuclease
LDELPRRLDGVGISGPGVHGPLACKRNARLASTLLSVVGTTMLARLGFVASVLSEGLSTSRTCRLKNATPERLRALAEENLATLDRVVSFLAAHQIRLYRITSNLIPFASHPVNTLRWWEEFEGHFTALGRRFRSADIRVSMHPGQFTVLNSPNPAIVAAAVAELEYHARVLDLLGADPSGKIVLHIGGLYGGTEAAAMDRFCAVASALPREVLRRLVIENDDRLFNAEEALTVAHRVGVPVVFDWLHHHANPCATAVEQVLPLIFATWKREDGRPKVHLSSQASDGPPGAHAADIKASDALAFFSALPPGPFDCMLEAKNKDRALLKLRTALRRRGIVESDAPI